MTPYWSSPVGELYRGDALAVLRELPTGIAHKKTNGGNIYVPH